MVLENVKHLFTNSQGNQVTVEYTDKGQAGDRRAYQVSIHIGRPSQSEIKLTHTSTLIFTNKVWEGPIYFLEPSLDSSLRFIKEANIEP